MAASAVALRFLAPPSTTTLLEGWFRGPASEQSFSCAVTGRSRRRSAGTVRACFNPFGDERILGEAMKEPVAFMGGVFAGLLRLDLNEDPLKEWITQTVEASGIAEEDNTEESSEGGQNDAPQQIEIE